jgi:glycosyltransferase involved in cell wall biosynthesis
MTRILFISLEGRIAGAEQSLLLLIKYLRKDFLCIVACPSQSPIDRKLAEIEVCSFDLPRPPRRFYPRISWLLHLLRTSFRVCKIARKVKPKVVHANGFYAVIVSVPAALVTRRTLVWHARDLTRFGLTSKICSLLCKRVIAVSDAVKNHLIAQGVRPERIDVVHNGVEVSGFDRLPQKTIEPALGCARIRFASIGQFVPWKRQALFLEAARKLVHKGVDAEFLLIGDDIFGRDASYKASLLNQMRNSGTAERISYLGWRQNLEDVWQKVDCLVHTADPEPFGRVIIEAMAHMIPVIAVNNCGPSEIIQNGKTGILVNANDPDELSEAMLKIAGDEAFARKLALAGYEQAILHFSAEETAGRVRKIYKQLLAA